MRVTAILFASFLLLVAWSGPALADPSGTEPAADGRQRATPKPDDTPPKVEYVELKDGNTTSPKELARLYFRAAEIEFQSGIRDPDAAVRYARKALEYPQTDFDRLRLGQMIASGMIRQSKGAQGEALAEFRRRTVVPLLEAIKYALDLHLPELSALPPQERGTLRNVTRSGSPSLAELAEEKRFRQEQKRILDAAMLRRRIEEIGLERKGLDDTIVSLYSRPPYDTDELKRIGMQMLQDEKTVDALVAKVNAAIQARANRTAAIGAPPAPVAPVEPAPVGVPRLPPTPQ